METTAKRFRKREAILACLQGTTSHPGAEWVFEQLKPQIPDLSLGTVYRNLSLFKEQGKIISVGTVKGVERFDANTAPHVHFICNGCGRVLDLAQIQVPTQLSDAAASSMGGRVDSCQLTFAGLCGACKTPYKEETP